MGLDSFKHRSIQHGGCLCHQMDDQDTDELAQEYHGGLKQRLVEIVKLLFLWSFVILFDVNLLIILKR